MLDYMIIFQPMHGKPIVDFFHDYSSASHVLHDYCVSLGGYGEMYKYTTNPEDGLSGYQIDHQEYDMESFLEMMGERWLDEDR